MTMEQPAAHLLTLTRPPLLVENHQGFGWSIHGTRGDEAYRNGFWVLNLASDGAGALELDGREHPFAHGWAVVAPPDRDHCYRFKGPTRKTYAHFRVPSGGSAAPVPVTQDLGQRFEWFRSTILEIGRLVAAEPERATAMLWHVLWSLTSGPAGGAAPVHHPVIRALLAHLAEHLAEPLDPGLVATRLDCSPTHLNRLCRAAFGVPLMAYVRRCRVERAAYLLRHTTRPVAAIAAEVGYPDLQHFNKLMRAAHGRSPREVRTH
jgi:AraC-like DNA-binding protein